MKPSEKEEVISYLGETILLLARIKTLALDRNKTSRIKAIISMLSIIEARIGATLNYAKYGGYDGLPVSLQKQLYDPIVIWLTEELSK